MLVYTPFALCFVTLRGIFMDFPELTRINSTNVQYEGLRIGEVGRRMNSKLNQSNKVRIKNKRSGELGLLSISPSPSSPGPYI
jgi:hypothetical protein